MSHPQSPLRGRLVPAPPRGPPLPRREWRRATATAAGRVRPWRDSSESSASAALPRAKPRKPLPQCSARGRDRAFRARETGLEGGGGARGAGPEAGPGWRGGAGPVEVGRRGRTEAVLARRRRWWIPARGTGRQGSHSLLDPDELSRRPGHRRVVLVAVNSSGGCGTSLWVLEARRGRSGCLDSPQPHPAVLFAEPAGAREALGGLPHLVVLSCVFLPWTPRGWPESAQGHKAHHLSVMLSKRMRSGLHNWFTSLKFLLHFKINGQGRVSRHQ